VETSEPGRRPSETEPLLGCFVNSLALRTRLPIEGTFREALRRVRQTTIEAFACADVPLEKLQQFHPSRDGTGRDFFRLWFGPIDSAQPFEMGGLKTEPG